MGTTMDLFEYQARELFAAHNVPVLKGGVASTPEAVRDAVASIGAAGVGGSGVGGAAVIKAQVKVGGRGKAGGIRVVADPAEAYRAAEEILGMDIKGHVVDQVMVVECAQIAAEYYFSIVLDRAHRSYLAMCSVQGGMDIETLVAENPAALAKEEVDPLVGIDEAKAREIVHAAGLAPDIAEKSFPC